VRARCERAGVLAQVELTLATPDDLRLRTPLDFCLAFWMVHEVPDRAGFLSTINRALSDGGTLLVVEPKIHVSRAAFLDTVQLAQKVGFSLVEARAVRLSRTAALLRPAGG